MISKHTMPWVAFLGADGSGKSTVINSLTEHLENRGMKVSYQHWRPELGEKNEDIAVVSDPHALPARSKISSYLRVVVLTGIWRISYLKSLAKLRSNGVFIIFDRFYADLLVDPRRYRYGGGKTFASFIFKFMPKPDLVILLDADAEVLYARKPEVALEPLREIVEGYRNYISNAKNGVLVNSDQNVEDVMSEVTSIVDDLLNNSIR